jgi:leucine dehydrogenase
MNAQVPVDWTNQEITVINHPRLGEVGAIVIDSLALGPAMGGCRFWSYDKFDDAVLDARRLARGMSYKNALAGLRMGGGKSVLLKPQGEFDRREIFRAFAEAVDFLEGRYVTAEDVGTKVSDMELVRDITPHVCGVTASPGQAGGDPSPWTAQGVFNSICAVADRLGEPLAGLRVAIQGLGNVGMSLADLLHDKGVEPVVADINPAAVDAAKSKFLAPIMSPDEVHRADVDIYAPCALGAILNERTIH